jgi:hypothetical protein
MITYMISFSGPRPEIQLVISTKHTACFLTALLLLVGTVLRLSAQTAVFTYQGRLLDGAQPANGCYNLRFRLADAATGGDYLGPTLIEAPVPVTNGLFTVRLDFGSEAFDGSERWLEIGVRTNTGGAFTVLAPRQQFTAAPYAVYSGNAAAAASLSGTLPANQLTGVLGSEQLPDEVLIDGAGGVTLSGTFFGDGAGLTNLPAASVPASASDVLSVLMNNSIFTSNNITSFGAGSNNTTQISTLSPGSLWLSPQVIDDTSKELGVMFMDAKWQPSDYSPPNSYPTVRIFREIGYFGTVNDDWLSLWCYNGRWEENGWGSTLMFGNELNPGGSITINRQPTYAERYGTNSVRGEVGFSHPVQLYSMATTPAHSPAYSQVVIAGMTPTNSPPTWDDYHQGELMVWNHPPTPGGVDTYDPRVYRNGLIMQVHTNAVVETSGLTLNNSWPNWPKAAYWTNQVLLVTSNNTLYSLHTVFNSMAWGLTNKLAGP